MLKLVIPGREVYDEEQQMFFYTESKEIQLEHSLVSISKWESKWHKPFLSKNEKTMEETLDYIRCMTITQNVDPTVYACLTEENYAEVKKYIEDSMTATTFSDDKNRPGSREIVTSELIYYWMISLNVPMECQRWHLSRLLTLIKVCSIKNAPNKKMSKRDIASKYSSLNAARRSKMHTRG